MRLASAAVLLALSRTALHAQTPHVAPSAPPPAIRRHVEAGQPFTVAGPTGLIVGQQEGSFEAWVLPVKLLSHFTIRAEVQGYSVPIELNPTAAEIEVFPDRTTITYSHIAFTVRQTMFAPADPQTGPGGTGAAVLFEIDSEHPIDFSFSFTPEMLPMWPKPIPGVPSVEWVTGPAGGSYILHTDSPALSGAISMPGARPGVLAPYQERPQVHPVELRLHFDPKADRGRSIPLLMAVGQTPESAANPALLARLAELERALPALLAANAAWFAVKQQSLTRIETPDSTLNEAFSWAEIAIEQLRARAQPTGEMALVAGYYASGDSARPGFGWFFGRDALYTLYAVNRMGDFALSRAELEFLIRRQRADGKIMHEFSQTAASVDWKSYPYMYAAADATPLFLTSMLDYVQSSGDLDFLRKHQDAVGEAWQFESTHDSDGDGIYDNAQGTGWVESWPGGMPHQEIYLALLDQQASAAMAKLAALLGKEEESRVAAARADEISAKIESEYFQPQPGTYAFSRNPDASLDRIATIYPALSWWNGGSGLKHPEASFRRWDSHDFSTDWGARDVAASEPIYDGMSYHQGSVWPLFTGWVSLADYRGGHPLSGFAHLMQNAAQTTSQDLGAITELLSGDFFQPFGRSTSHQLWSSAMVITPVILGLFGIESDATAHVIRVNPHLPATWDHAEIRGFRVGETVCDLLFRREGDHLNVHLQTSSGPPLRLESAAPGSKMGAERGTLIVPLPAVEVAIDQALPLPGARTSQMKVLAETPAPRSLTLELEGMAGSTSSLHIRLNQPTLKLTGDGISLAPPTPAPLRTGAITFPPGAGYVPQTVTLRW